MARFHFSRTSMRAFLVEVGTTLCAIILIVAVYFGTQTLWLRYQRDDSYIKAATRSVADFPLVRVGEVAKLQNAALDGTSYWFVIYSSPNCEFCKSSAPFYRRLLAAAARKLIPVILALPDPNRDTEVAPSLGLSAALAVNWRQLSFKVTGTPTIVLLTPTGKVQMYWLGQLTPAAELEVLRAVETPERVFAPVRHLPSGEQMLTVRDVRAMAQTQMINIINVSERLAYRGRRYDWPASNIPLDELVYRASFELDSKYTQLVDCTGLPTVMCAEAVRRLSERGYNAGAANLDDN